MPEAVISKIRPAHAEGGVKAVLARAANRCSAALTPVVSGVKILPAFPTWQAQRCAAESGGRPCPDGSCYCSDTNTQWLSTEELRIMVGAPEEDVSSR
jgi:hypothetical protein